MTVMSGHAAAFLFLRGHALLIRCPSAGAAPDGPRAAAGPVGLTQATGHTLGRRRGLRCADRGELAQDLPPSAARSALALMCGSRARLALAWLMRAQPAASLRAQLLGLRYSGALAGLALLSLPRGLL